MSDSLIRLPVAETLRLYKAGKLSPVEMARAAIAVVEKHAGLNALCAFDAKKTLAMARASEKRWRSGDARPFDGVTVTVKDWYDLRGFPTRQGAMAISSVIKTEDSLPVAALRRAGCVFIGKTTLPEFGHKGVTDSPLHGITRNPWDKTKTCGGSSGGAAVAAATGMAQWNMGSDAGGSIRIPASFSGVFGFKPTPGRVRSWPPSLFSDMSSAGPLTNGVEDAILMTEVLTGEKIRSSRPSKLKIAYATEINGTAATPEVKAVLDKKIALLSPLGKIEKIKLGVPDVVETFNSLWMAVASLIAANFPQPVKKKMDPRFLHWAARGDKLHLHDYLAAQKRRLEIAAYFAGLFEKHDVILTPTTAMTAFDVGQNMPRDKNGKWWDDWTPFTYPANLARLPAASIPAGLAKNGLPVGLQIMAATGNDDLVLNVSARVEAILRFPALS